MHPKALQHLDLAYYANAIRHVHKILCECSARQKQYHVASSAQPSLAAWPAALGDPWLPEAASTVHEHRRPFTTYTLLMLKSYLQKQGSTGPSKIAGPPPLSGS